MGKKYVVIEVNEPSHDPDDENGIAYPFLLIPPILSMTSLCVFRYNGPWMYPRKIWILAIISMVITFAVSIGVFFGVSYLSAAIPFMLFLWSGANLAHGIIGDIGSKKVKDFIENTRIDVAIFFCILFLVIGGIAETCFALQPEVTDRSVINLIWLICVVCILHFSAIFLLAYLNEHSVGEGASGFLHFGLTLLYLSPALFYINIAVEYVVAPVAVISLLEPIGANQVSFYLVLSISAAFMIAEGIALIVGHGDGCARFGILQGILNFVFAALAVASAVLSFNFAPPAAVHIKNVSDWKECESTRETIHSLGEREVHYYLDNDIDFNGDGEQILQITIDRDDIFDGQGHKLINVVVRKNGYGGVFASNRGVIKNLTLERCIIYSSFNYTGSIGAFVCSNSGIIENCHAIETYVYYSSKEESSYHAREKSVEVGGIAGINYGTIKNCSFENSDLNAAFPYSILHPSWATFSEIAYNEDDETIIDCSFFGTHGKGEAEFEPNMQD